MSSADVRRSIRVPAAISAVGRWLQGPPSSDAADETVPPAPSTWSAFRLFAPYVLVLGVTGLLFFSRFEERSGERNVFVGLALVTVILVVARQFITLRENERLNQELHSFSQGLETMVEQRTARLAALHDLASALSAASSRSVVARQFEEAARLIARSLDAEYSEVLELDAARERLLMRAGVGWGKDRGEALSLSAAPGFEPGYVLSRLQPVLVEDMADETRFSALKLHRERGVVSSVSVVIPPRDRPFGVLSAHSTLPHSFTEEDVHCLQSVANVLGQTIERVRAEEELRREHAQTEQLLESISLVLVGVGSGGEVQLWNRAAEETFGIPSGEVLRRAFRECPLEWDWAEIERGVERCLRSASPERIADVRYRRPDGTEVFLSLGVNPVSDGAGARSGYLLIGVDITERRVLEAQLTQAQKLESIGQLAAGIAHEINTPTQYVGDNTRFLQDAFEEVGGLMASYAELLTACEEGHPGDALLAEVSKAAKDAEIEFLCEEIPKAIRESLEGIESISRIVQAMKEFSHPGSEDKTPLDLNKAIASTITVARNEWKYVADLETQFDPTLPLVSCLPGEFNQVILNVVINAADAIADAASDGSTTKGKITVSTRRDGDWVEIRVADTGTGIPEEVRPRVFDPFFTTKQVGKGSGQGLAISHSVIVDKHAGTITFDTEVGKGTTFVIRLPIVGDTS